MFSRTMRTIAGVAIVGLTLALSPATQSVARAQALYTIVDLGVCSPSAINASGQVTGTKRFSTSHKGDHAFLWNPATPNTLVDRGVVSGHDYSIGRAINNLGDIAGSGGKATGTSFFPILVPASGSAQIVGTSGTNLGYAFGVNDSRDVVGRSTGAFLSKIVSGKRKTFIVGPGWARNVNYSGQIYADNNGNGINYGGGYLWTPSGAAGQGTAANIPSEYQARALTNAGALAGARNFMVDTGSGPELGSRPVVYFPGSLIDIGIANTASWLDVPLPPAPPQGPWYWSVAFGLNSTGVVVGTAEASDPAGTYLIVIGWIWDATNGARDLSSLVAGSGWVDMYPRGINDNGWIVGSGKLNGVDRGFVLKPI